MDRVKLSRRRSREESRQAECGQELLRVIRRVSGEDVLLRSFGISGLEGLGKIVQISAGLRDERQVPSFAVTGINRRDAAAGKRFELIETLQPALDVPFGEIEVCAMVHQVRGKKRLQGRDMKRSDMLALAFAEFDDGQFVPTDSQRWFIQRLGNDQPVRPLRAQLVPQQGEDTG